MTDRIDFVELVVIKTLKTTAVCSYISPPNNTWAVWWIMMWYYTEITDNISTTMYTYMAFRNAFPAEVIFNYIDLTGTSYVTSQ